MPGTAIIEHIDALQELLAALPRASNHGEAPHPLLQRTRRVTMTCSQAQQCASGNGSRSVVQQVWPAVSLHANGSRWLCAGRQVRQSQASAR